MSDEVLLVDNVPIVGASPDGAMISVWTLNRPEKLNALNADSHTALNRLVVMLRRMTMFV